MRAAAGSRGGCHVVNTYSQRVSKGVAMNESQAKQVAQQLDPGEGDVIFFQSDGQIMHPHYHSGGFGPRHVDAWACRKKWGSLEIAKIHSDDEFNDHYKINWKDVSRIW